ncbi:MAG: polyketide cyclase [Alphaproteobacteria bacterium PA2]|nr:MAG: polyketide cyclase [Alphaproteobacteria bacterium PA2]
MSLKISALIGALSLAMAGAAQAAPEYAVIKMTQTVDRPAAAVWAKVGGYCDLGVWMKIDCKITSGDGGIGSVRAIAGGRVTEVMVGKTDLSYGYVQPAVEGRFYNLYHGFLEAKAVTARTSVLNYTLVYDVSNLPDQAAKDADIARRRTMFMGALTAMKTLAEAK